MRFTPPLPYAGLYLIEDHFVVKLFQDIEELLLQPWHFLQMVTVLKDGSGQSFVELLTEIVHHGGANTPSTASIAEECEDDFVEVVADRRQQLQSPFFDMTVNGFAAALSAAQEKVIAEYVEAHRLATPPSERELYALIDRLKAQLQDANDRADAAERRAKDAEYQQSSTSNRARAEEPAEGERPDDGDCSKSCIARSMERERTLRSRIAGLEVQLSHEICRRCDLEKSISRVREQAARSGERRALEAEFRVNGIRRELAAAQQNIQQLREDVYRAHKLRADLTSVANRAAQAEAACETLRKAVKAAEASAHQAREEAYRARALHCDLQSAINRALKAEQRAEEAERQVREWESQRNEPPHLASLNSRGSLLAV